MNRPPPVRGEDFALTLATVGIGLVLGLATLLWMSGQLAAVAVHQAWPSVPITSSPSILVRLADHLSEPARAWPPSARGQVPGAVAVYIVLVLLLVALGFAAALGLRCLARIRQRNRRAERDRSDVWARPEQVRNLLLNQPAPNRVVLGRLNGRTVAAEARRSVLVVAPTQAGKTSRFVVPTISRWDGPLIVTSVKSDVLLQTVARRRVVSGDQIRVFDPTGAVDPSHGIDASCWSPLLLAATYPEADRAARWLIKAAEDDRPDVNGRFWENTAAKLLAPLLFAAANTAGDLGTLSYWIDTKETAEVDQILRELGDTNALNAWAATCHRESRTHDSAYATAESIASAFTSPTVRTATTITDASLVINAEEVLDKKQTVYLVAPVDEQELYAPLFIALIQSIVRAAQRRYAANGQALDPPLMLMLDEAAHVAPLPNLPVLAATGAGQGIQMCSVWQDLAQIEDRYAKRARSLFTNHTARVFLTGSADDVMLEQLSRMIGDHPVMRETRSVDENGRRTRTRSKQDTRLAPVDYLRTLPDDTAVVLYGREPAMRLTTTPWFDDPVIRAQLRHPPSPAGPRHPQDPPPPVAPPSDRPPTGSTSSSTLEAPMVNNPSSPADRSQSPNEPTHSTLAGLTDDPDHSGFALDEDGRRYLISPAPDGSQIPIPFDLTDDERAELDAARDRLAGYAAELRDPEDDEPGARIVPLRPRSPAFGEP